jgi:hypothetical protein
MKGRLVILLLLLAVLANGAPAQPTLRFSLKTDALALPGCVAQPGNVPVPLAAGDLNLEIVNWLSAPAPTNHTAEFLLRFNAPTPVGSVIAYEPGVISFLSDEAWTALSPVDGAGRKLQVIPFPQGAQVEAIKFSVPSHSISGAAADVGIHRASLPFATFLPIRVVNIAGDAVATASSAAPANRAAVLNDGLLGPERNFATAPRPNTVSPEKPEWLQLTWAGPKDFRGIAFFHGRMETGAGHAVFETFRGDGDPNASVSTDNWEPMRLRSTAPGRFGANQFFVSMQPIQSRALRITSTGAVSQITLGEMVVLNHLDAVKPLEPPKNAEPKTWVLPKFAKDRIQIDGKADDWPAGRTNGFALAFDEDRLFLLYEAKGSTASFDNKGTNVNELFQTGDAIDLQLQTRGAFEPQRAKTRAGDLRLIFSMFEGKPVCVLYDYHSDDLLVLPVTFVAGERSVACDRVGVFKDAEIRVVRSGETLVFEASLPLPALSVYPSVTKEIAGDIGRIIGASSKGGGSRRYWSNADTNLPPDLPAGAEIRPTTWGRLRLGSE